MKNAFLFFALVVSVGIANAQYKTARVDTDLLTRSVYPEFESEFQAFQKHIDSLYTSLEQDEQIKGYLQTIQANDRSNEEAQMKLATAMQEINRIQNRMTDVSRQIYMERFGDKMNRLNELINTYQSENAFDLVFDFSSQGMDDTRFISQEVQNAVQKSIADCMGMPEGLDADQYRVELDKRLPPCQEKILKPLLDASVDITEQVVKSNTN